MGKYGFKKAFSWQNITFYGGTAPNVARSFPFDMMINLSGQTDLFEDEADKVFKNYNAANALAENTPRLDIDWPDYGLPKLSQLSWFGLMEDVKAFCSNKKQKYEIAVFCVGGHGRTGTTLAILKSFLLNEKGDPVLTIRKCYDESAVETYGQINYVSFITGRKTKAQPIPAKNYTTGKTVTQSTNINTPGYKPSKTVLDIAKADGQELCKHWFDNVGTRMKDCKDCDKFIEWLRIRNAEKMADKYLANKPATDVITTAVMPVAASHTHHKVFIPSCVECVKEDNEETQQIQADMENEGGMSTSGYVEVDAEEVVANLLKTHLELH